MWKTRSNCEVSRVGPPDFADGVRTKFVTFCMLGGIVGLLVVGPLASNASAKCQGIRNLRKLWAQGNYLQITKSAKQYRKDCGGSFELDYMIATSLSRVENTREEGYEYFRWIQDNYKDLDSGARQIVAEEQRRVRQDPRTRPLQIQFRPTIQRSVGYSGQGAPPEMRRPTNGEVLATSRFSQDNTKVRYGFTIEEWDNGSDFNDNVAEGQSAVSVDDLSAHLFNTNQMMLAIRDVRKTVGPSFKIHPVGHFLLVSSDVATTSQLHDAGLLMERFYQRLPPQFKAGEQDQIITVYLFASYESFAEHAKNTHRLRFGEANVKSYSIVEDLSINVETPTRARSDTRQYQFPKRFVDETDLYRRLIFELFRLVLSVNGEDIPFWLYQGLSGFVYYADVTRGLPRSGEVRQKPGMSWLLESPPLTQLLSEETSGADPLRFRDGVAFVAYLNDKSLLAKAYGAFRSAVPGRVSKNDFELSRQVMESLFKKPLSAIDRDFSVWLKHHHKKTVNLDEGPSAEPLQDEP